MAPKPTRFLPEKQILSAFDSLSDLNHHKRKEAINTLVDCLSKHEPEEKNVFPELKYTVNRLVRGLGSSREMSRQGFAAALITVLKRFDYFQNNELYKLKVKHLRTNTTTFSIAAPTWLGVIFFYNVMLLTSRLEEQQYMVKAARELIGLLKKKEYMYQPVLSTLYQIMLKMKYDTFKQEIYPLLSFVLSCEDIRPYVVKLVTYFAYPSKVFNIFPDIKPQKLYSKDGISKLAQAIYGLTHFYEDHFSNIGFKMLATQLYRLNKKEFYNQFRILVELGLPETHTKEVVTARTRRRMNIALSILFELLHQIRPEHLDLILTPSICSQLGNLSLCSGINMKETIDSLMNELLSFAEKSHEHKQALFRVLNHEDIKAEFQEGFKPIYRKHVKGQDSQMIDNLFKGNFMEQLGKHKIRFRDITPDEALKVIKLIVGTMGYRSTTEKTQEHERVRIFPSLTEEQEKELRRLADEYQYFLGKNESCAGELVSFCRTVEQDSNIRIHTLSTEEQWARKQLFKLFNKMEEEKTHMEKKQGPIPKQHRCMLYFVSSLLIFQVLDKVNIAQIIEDLVLSYSLLFETDEIEIDSFEGDEDEDDEMGINENAEINGNNDDEESDENEEEESDDDDDDDDESENEEESQEEKDGQESEDLIDSDDDDDDDEEEEQEEEEEENDKDQDNDDKLDEKENNEDEKVIGQVSGVQLLIDSMMRLVVEHGDTIMPFAKLILRKFHHDIDKKSLQLITDIAFMTDTGKAAIEAEDTEGVSMLSKIPMKDLAPPNVMPTVNPDDTDTEEFEDMDQLTDEQIDQLDTSLGQIFKFKQQALDLEKSRQYMIRRAQRRGITLLLHLVQSKRLNPVILTLLWPMVRTIFRQERTKAKNKNTQLQADLITVCMKICSSNHTAEGVDVEDATETIDRVFKLFCTSISDKLLKVCQTVIIYLIKAVSTHTWPYQPLIDVIAKRFKNLGHPKDPHRSKFVKALISTNLELLVPMLQVVSQTADSSENRSSDHLLVLDVLIAAAKSIKEKNVALFNRIIDVLATTLPTLRDQLGSKKPLLKRIVQVASGLRISIKKAFTAEELKQQKHAGIHTDKLKRALTEATKGFSGVHVGNIRREIQFFESDTLAPPPKQSKKKSKNNDLMNHQETASSSSSAKPDLSASKPQNPSRPVEASTPKSAKVGQKRKHEKTEIGLSPAMKKRRLK